MMLAGTISYGIFLTGAGYLLSFAGRKKTTQIIAWLLVVVTVVFSLAITEGETALCRMIVIVGLQLLSMKVVVYVFASAREPRLNFIQWMAFALGWFGMRPYLFQSLFSRPLPFARILVKGLSRIVIGIALLYVSFLVDQAFITNYFAAALSLVMGLSFILHFGILNIVTALWRSLGVDVRELFKSPYKSKSLKEFWGQRWNIAFAEMTAIVAYKPLKKKYSRVFAMTICFLVSGLLHEIAISFPVMAGFGLPMLYFSIHALLMYWEESSAFVKRIIAHPITSHIWVLGWLLLPMPLLFHKPFLEQVLVPLRQALLTRAGII